MRSSKLFTNIAYSSTKSLQRISDQFDGCSEMVINLVKRQDEHRYVSGRCVQVCVWCVRV